MNKIQAIPIDSAACTRESLTLRIALPRLKDDSFRPCSGVPRVTRTTQNFRSMLLAVTMTFMSCAVLAGCSWPEWATLDDDPLAFMASEPPPRPAPPAPQNSPLSLQAQYDPMVNAPDLEMKDGGTMGSLGLNMDTYFDPNLRDDSKRIDRVERALVAIHRDLQAMAPTLQKFASAPPEVQQAYAAEAAKARVLQPSPMSVPTQASTAPTSLTQPVQMPQNTVPQYADQHLSALPPLPNGKSFKVAPRTFTPQQNYQPAQMPQNTMPPQRAQELAASHQGFAQNAPSTTQQNYAAPSGNGALIQGVRVGEHPDKIRLVLDVSKKTAWRADLDNNEGLLVVELPDATWNGSAMSDRFGKLPVLRSYRVEPMNNGAGYILIAQLKKNTQIINQAAYPALSGHGKRLVVDLAK